MPWQFSKAKSHSSSNGWWPNANGLDLFTAQIKVSSTDGQDEIGWKGCVNYFQATSCLHSLPENTWSSSCCSRVALTSHNTNSKNKHLPSLPPPPASKKNPFPVVFWWALQFSKQYLAVFSFDCWSASVHRTCAVPRLLGCNARSRNPSAAI